MNTSYCPRCELHRPIADFGKDRARKKGIQVYCLACRRIMATINRPKWNPARYQANPSMFKAHVYVGRAIKSGRLTKPSICPKCGIAGRRLEGHHYLGYAKEHWLDVEWMCRSCHIAGHKAEKFGGVI